MRILYIDIDALRPDHLSCYGYIRKTSPHIDAIAAEGVRFNQCYTPDAPCLPSRTALYSGRFGIQTGVVGHGGTASEPKTQGPSRSFTDHFNGQGLARQLQWLGFHTAMISPFGQRHSAHWFYAGFNEIHNTGKGGVESAEEVWPALDQWLKNNVDNNPRDNWFLHVNFWDVHTPYRVPMDYGDPFKDAPLPPHLEDEQMIARHVKKTGPHSAMDPGMFSDANPSRYPREVAQIKDRATLRHWINGYDAAIKYVDDYIGQVVDRLKKAGVYDDTAIIISSDHGENQAELGIYGEHGTADVATCRIPMIIKWPKSKAAAGMTDDQLRYNIDLAPTLMDLLNGRQQPLWDGQSYAHIFTGAPSPAPREDIVISQCAHVCQRGVRWADYLYIRTYHDGFHLFPQEMLFDLKADPFEQNDIADQRPELCREGAWRLSRWHDQQMQKMAKITSEVADPLWTVIHEGGPYHALPDRLPKYLERLEQTNRADGAEALRRKYGHLLPKA